MAPAFTRLLALGPCEPRGRWFPDPGRGRPLASRAAPFPARRRLRLRLAACYLLQAVGIGASLWASSFAASLLYGLEPRDPATLAGAALVLTTVGVTAGWLPAHRASRIDPAVVLRDS
jgi:hypothetical protein